MRSLFARLSIRSKLLAIIMLASGSALLLACAAFVIYDLRIFRGALIEETVSLARMVSKITPGALEFDNPEEAKENLQAFQQNPAILSSAIFRLNSSEPFAVFAKSPLQAEWPPPPGAVPARRFAADYLDVWQPIESGGEVVGVLHIRTGLEALYNRIRNYIAIALCVLLVSSALAFLISVQLQKVISRPVLGLARTTEVVSRTKDYSIRAEASNQDEIGVLINGFNEMLAQLQIRDAALQTAQQDLEKRVEERTAELQQEIVERKRAMEQLRSFARKLEISNRELQDFAYVASHDLQEPLRKVQAFGDRLKTRFEAELGTEGGEYLDRMLNAARRMQTLIDDLLAFSRVSTKTNPFTSVDLKQILREVLSDLEVRIQSTEATVHVETLPSIEADPMQMRQLFQNLLSNALKFHRPGVPPEIRVSARMITGNAGSADTPLCEIQVSDNGIGFEEKYLDRIFTVFQRLHGRGTYEGTGIGLAICRKIVDRHGGQITARSTPGAGATFVVQLPAEQSSEA